LFPVDIRYIVRLTSITLSSLYPVDIRYIVKFVPS